MTDQSLRSAYRWPVLIALIGFLALTGYWLLFTTFMIYDDEGYVLLSLQNFSLHGGLYDRVYTQYGPFPYLLYDALHRILGFDFTNENGRWITLVNWLTTAIVCATLVGRTTRSLVWTCFTLVGVFTLLWVMTHEPIHPGSLTTMTIALCAWLGAEAWNGRRFACFIRLCGFGFAALAMTKINVGVLFAGAVGTWLSLNSTLKSSRRILLWLVALGCVALPFVLMGSMIDAPWVRLLSFVFAAGALGSLLTAQRVSQPVIGITHWRALFLWSLCGVGIIGGFALARGTSVHGLINGIVLAPLKHPGVYFFPVQWKMGAGVLALVSLTAVSCIAWKNAWQNRRLLETVAIIRLLTIAACLLGPVGLPAPTMAAWALSYGISLTWLFVLPLRSDIPTGGVRAWISFLLIFEMLQVYPVAGSQLNWGTFLWVPLLALGLHDASPVLQDLMGKAGRWGPKAATLFTTATTLFMATKLAHVGYGNYRTSQPLLLRGAENLRPPHDLASALKIAVLNLRTHADILFSFPGLYSANLWTGLPTPTFANTTHWFSLLSDEQQQEIIDKLAVSPRAALLVHRELVDDLQRNGFDARGPLHTWLMEHFMKAVAFGGYEIWVHQGRTIAPLFTAAPGRDTTGALVSLVLTLQNVVSRVARIELCDVSRPATPLFTFLPENTSVRVIPCGLDGQPSGPENPATFPINTEPLCKVALHFTPIVVHGPVGRLMLILRDDAGHVVGEVLMAE